MLLFRFVHLAVFLILCTTIPWIRGCADVTAHNLPLIMTLVMRELKSLLENRDVNKMLQNDYINVVSEPGDTHVPRK